MDYRSIKESEIYPTSIYKERFERQGQTVSINYSSDQQWYFLDRQGSHEVTLIKIWDNKHGVANCKPKKATSKCQYACFTLANIVSMCTWSFPQSSSG